MKSNLKHIIHALEIDLIVLLAIALLFGFVFGIALAKNNPQEQASNETTPMFLSVEDDDLR